MIKNFLHLLCVCLLAGITALKPHGIGIDTDRNKVKGGAIGKRRPAAVEERECARLEQIRRRRQFATQHYRRSPTYLYNVNMLH